MTSKQAASAVNRFGLGAKPGELGAVGDGRDWLLSQFQRAPSVAAFGKLPSSREYLQREYAYNRERQARKRSLKANDGDQAVPAESSAKGKDDVKRRRQALGDGFRETFGKDQLAELGARYHVASTTDAGFAERLVRFWSNHFAISIDKRPATLYAAPMEREAIRPHVFGRFEDLLIAAETHPGMLRYLDNAQSVGEGSMFATRGAQRLQKKQSVDRPKRKFGLNENLAREILELHTLGVDGGYLQADVTELARAITGWGTPMPREIRGGERIESAFVFHAAAHEPGARNVLNKRYAEDGVEQGRAVLIDLARHPSTARHLSLKLARHFVADRPPPALVQAMASAYLKSHGDLATVYRTMIQSDLAWSAGARKFKTPDDFLVSALRAGGVDAGANPESVFALLRQLGQPVFMPRSPAGFADTAADWTGPDALWKRVQTAQALALRVPQQQLDPLRIAQSALGDALDADTATALRRAESARDGVALLFASPSFQWRT